MTLDTLDLRQDTLYCTLSNRTDLKLVIADAVRLIPVETSVPLPDSAL